MKSKRLAVLHACNLSLEYELQAQPLDPTLLACMAILLMSTAELDSIVASKVSTVHLQSFYSQVSIFTRAVVGLPHSPYSNCPVGLIAT